MTEFPVTYKLYAENGTSLVYTFTYVQEDNSPQDPVDYVEIEGLRGTGSIVIQGSTKAWNLVLRFFLKGNDYEDLIAKMDALETTIVKFTRYVLKISRTSSTTKDYHVMRLEPFQFLGGDFRTDYQEVICTLRVNTW